MNFAPSMVLEEIVTGVDKMPPAFRIPYQDIILEAEAVAKLPVHFVPFAADEFEASLYFIDENVGEFLYQLKGKGLMPNITETFTYTSKSNSRVEKALRVPIANMQRDKALFSFINSMSKSKMKRDRENTNTLKALYEIPVNDQLKYKVKRPRI